MKHTQPLLEKKTVLFVALWFFATVYLGWQVWLGQSSSNLLLQWPTFIVLILITLVLLWWISIAIPRQTPDGDRSIGKVKGVFLIIITTCLLFALPVMIGANLLWLLPPLAVAVLYLIRKPIVRYEIKYALLLSLIAGVAAIWAGWITQFATLMWSLLQLLLVSTGCIAGWQLLRSSGLLQLGIGRSCVLSQSVAVGMRHFVCGAAIALPWALGIVALGGAQTETWVSTWWHPFTAIQPAISEEAWGRLLLVPLFFYLTRRVYRPRAAFSLALVIVGYWFAFLHTVGSPGAVFNTLFSGTLYVLPVSYLCLYKDLETAIGFHF